MEKVIAEAELVAPTEATVLLTGESGTGKERVAEFIHFRSQRASGAFVRVNCATIPPSLVESEFFGYAKGAFTGAGSSRTGRFETACGGTILLDEIGELPLEVQPKLLRVLESGEFQRIGESKTRYADVRVIACTNRNLEKEMEEGRFREDLFWRLNVFRVHLPSLRERKEEISPLVRAFLVRSGKAKTRVSPSALRVLEAYPWPGNVRELANVIQRAAILAAGNVILPEHLPDPVRLPSSGENGHPAVESEAGEVETIETAERLAIQKALQSTSGNRAKAAKLLGISRRTLFYKLKQYGGGEK